MVDDKLSAARSAVAGAVDAVRHAMAFGSCAVLLPLVVGCASSTPAPARVFVGPTVHVWQRDPTVPLALYRFDPDAARAASRATGRGRGGGRRGAGGGSDGRTQPGDVDLSAHALLCHAPCGRPIATSGAEEFFIGGAGTTTSARFHLDPSLQRLDIGVSPGSSARLSGGKALLGVAGAALILSGITLPEGVSDGNRGAAITGAVFLGLGVAAIAAGVPLVVTGQTRLSFTPGDVALRF